MPEPQQLSLTEAQESPQPSPHVPGNGQVWGLLWMDVPKDLSPGETDRVRVNVIAAVTRFREKFGVPATWCLVHPSMLEHDKRTVAGVLVRAAGLA